MWRQACVRVVDSQVKAELGPRGKHAVGLVSSLGDQVVDQNACVSFRAVERERLFVADEAGGVDARHKPLASGFFVARGSVDLTGKVKPLELFDAQRTVEFGGIDGVILDGVAGAQQFGVFKTGNAVYHRGLNLDGKRCAHAIDIDLVRVQALGFKEELMRKLVRKADDLVFDRRAVARSNTFDLAGVHGRAMYVVPN